MIMTLIVLLICNRLIYVNPDPRWPILSLSFSDSLMSAEKDKGTRREGGVGKNANWPNAHRIGEEKTNAWKK
jgi:hypothetical protein